MTGARPQTRDEFGGQLPENRSHNSNRISGGNSYPNFNLMLDCTHLSPQEDYLLAISGGRDSVALLHLLLEQGFHHLHLVHLNHQLRGEDSDGDAAFVRDLAKRHDLAYTIHRAEVATIAQEEQLSVEAAARKARHQLFSQVARATRCPRILLAHHAEDQAETILFNLLRGASGLKGMQGRSLLKVADSPLHLLRPLLSARRSEIDSYLLQKKIGHRQDRSNAEPIFARNRIRLEALPLLCEILHRDVVPALNRAQEVSSQNEQLLADLLTHLELLDPQGRLFLPKLRELPASLQQAALTRFLKNNQVSKISHQVIKDAVTLIAPDGPPKLNLPGNRFLRRSQARIFLT